MHSIQAYLSLAALCTLLAATPARANTFLARDLPDLAEEGMDLLKELERVAGQGRRAAIESRVGLLEEALRPTFQALPRGAGERLGAPAVRYLLHRLFVDRHGWFVRGLDSAGEAWNSSSPAEVFKGHAGEVHGLFEDRLGAGFSLRDVAALAATLESFVHGETVERLHAAYRLANLSETSDEHTEEEVSKAIDTYMSMYVLGTNHTTATKAEVAATWEVIDQAYPHWTETQKWVREIRKEVLAGSGEAAAPIARTAFDTTTRVLEEIAERYGRWQDRECQQIKTSLMHLEHGSTGRVRLETFYGAALNGSWQFSESKAYLRQLGALDESEPLRASVIIPNYVNSPSNCVASSKFYKVCCINECEGLLAHLERRIAAPDASPARIAELVAEMSSSTVPAPRKLPASLLQRLDEIASQHNGKVPFHGRLFAQWLHHAYPRECPYPQLSGTSTPTSPERWAEMTGEEAVADQATMLWHIEEARRSTGGKAAPPPAEVEAEELPWSAEEELFVSRPAPPVPEAVRPRFAVGGGLALIAAAVSLGVSLARSVVVAKDAMSAADAHKKYLV